MEIPNVGSARSEYQAHRLKLPLLMYITTDCGYIAQNVGGGEGISGLMCGSDPFWFNKASSPPRSVWTKRLNSGKLKSYSTQSWGNVTWTSTNAECFWRSGSFESKRFISHNFGSVWLCESGVLARQRLKPWYMSFKTMFVSFLRFEFKNIFSCPVEWPWETTLQQADGKGLT